MSLAPSPTAARVVEILDYLATRPTDSFTTSQLARALDQNRTTCQSVLLSLEAARMGAPDRREDVLARVVRRSWPGRRRWRRCPSSTISKWSWARCTPNSESRPWRRSRPMTRWWWSLASDRTARWSRRFTSASPCRSCRRSAWPSWRGTTTRSTDGWRVAPTRCPPPTSNVLRRGAAVVRGLGLLRHARSHQQGPSRRCYSRTRSCRAVARCPRVRRDQLVDSLAHDEYVMLDIEHQADQPVSQISAPVFGADRRVLATLSVMAFPNELIVEDMPRVAERLRTSAQAVTRRITGSPRV